MLTPCFINSAFSISNVAFAASIFCCNVTAFAVNNSACICASVFNLLFELSFAVLVASSSIFLIFKRDASLLEINSLIDLSIVSISALLFAFVSSGLNNKFATLAVAWFAKSLSCPKALRATSITFNKPTKGA